MRSVSVIRKPVQGKVAKSTLDYGGGGLNIDACRVGTDWAKESSVRLGHADKSCSSSGVTGWGAARMHAEPHPKGRWPANLVRNGDMYVLNLLPITTIGKVTPGTMRGTKSNHSVSYADMAAGSELTGYGDSGSSARFFYAVARITK